MALLLAKYVAVVTVAMLTATINLAMMLITLDLNQLTGLVFKGSVTVGLIVQVFFLLLLFAAFFSAVLLAVTSFARSFKEAQAYLVPLMLVSLTPGMLSLLPGLRLRGPTLVVPLLNIVLLARDLFEGGTSAAEAAWRVLGNVVLFFGFPLASLWLRRVRVPAALGLERPGARAWVAAALFGLSLWPFADLVREALRRLDLATLNETFLAPAGDG